MVALERGQRGSERPRELHQTRVQRVKRGMPIDMRLARSPQIEVGTVQDQYLLRHAFMHIPAVSVVKIEMIENSVLRLNNEFMVTYFIGSTLYDKKFIFKAQSITPDYVEEVPILFVDGVIVR